MSLDKDGCGSRSNTIKANSESVKERIWTLDSHFANKNVTEQIWIISVTSKIVLQPLELDTDGELHNVPGGMWTPWKLLVNVMTIKVAQKMS